jgi:magnesium-transporting ATPase (P-type)
MAQYWFGFASVFSGQPLYEPFIYQMYNMHMTGLPIVYYSIFDFQYTKAAFMKHPEYYKLGFDHKFFNFRVFWWWIAYAMIYCGLMNVFCIYVPSIVNGFEGKGFGLWACGHTVLECSVVLCNIKMLLMFNVWTGWGELLVFLSIASFYVNMYIEA